jgi:hypothetical protein
MGETPKPLERACAIGDLKNHDTFITMEPVLDFDLEAIQELIAIAKPKWVNIGADSGKNGLKEPDSEKLEMLIYSLYDKVTVKKNMERLR